MASTFTATNISHMNQKQLQTVAFNVGVNPVTVMKNSYGNNVVTRKALIAAIKAK